MAKYGSNLGVFVANTWILDVAKIGSVNVNAPEFKELLVRLYQNLSLMNNALNLKVSGYLIDSENVTGKLLFPDPASSGNFRQYRSVYSYVVGFWCPP